jgi:hypothetical protein
VNHFPFCQRFARDAEFWIERDISAELWLWEEQGQTELFHISGEELLISTTK